MNYDEALDHLDSLINYEVAPRAGIIEGLSLEPITTLMGLLGDPQGAYPVIHVTGTNGKGSTIRLVEAMLTAMGLRVGTYTSPHLERVNERIRVGAEPIDDEDFGTMIGNVALAASAQELGPLTWFETTTAAALRHFADEAVDVAVIEVGMLGRYDATNVVSAQIAVVTNVGLDHTSGEGDWRRSIAEEKAGIIEHDSVLVLGESDPVLADVFADAGPQRTVRRDTDFALVEDQLAVGGRGITIRTPRARLEQVFLRLHGRHQGNNAALAVTVVEEFFDAALPEDVIIESFDTIEVPGRLEIIHRGPLVVIDAAHNVPGAEALARTVALDFGEGRRRFLVIGMQDGRDPLAMCRALEVDSYELVVTCTAPTARGVDALVLRDAAAAAGAVAEAVVDVESALDHVLGQVDSDDMVVVAGSSTVVGAVRAIADEI